MKSKDIRKEKAKKRHVAEHSNITSCEIVYEDTKYYVFYDQYDATVKKSTGNSISEVGIYKAAQKTWKKGYDALPPAIRSEVEMLYY